MSESQKNESSKNKNTRIILGVAIVGLIIIGLSVAFGLMKTVAPDQGQQAVLIHKPMLWGQEGLDPVPVNTGRRYVWRTTEVLFVDIQPQQKTIPFDDLMSSDGVPLDFEGSLRLQVIDAVELIKRFGPNWYVNNIEKEYANYVRQAVRKKGMNETAINTIAIDSIDEEVFNAMQEYVKQIDCPVKIIAITIGKANPPDSIKNQRIETATEDQRALTEVRRKLAEDERKNSETSRANADNAYREAMGLSPDQFLELERIKMQRSACEKGNCTFLNSSGIMPTYNLGKK